MLITDQVATAPCTDRVQARRLTLRQSHLAFTFDTGEMSEKFD